MERILIVDDDERLCASVAQSLKSGGYNTRSVTDPRRVEESVAEGIFDCAIVDLRMLPELGGLEVAKKLKSIDPAIAIVFLTGTGTVSDAVEAFKLGATDFLIKPVGHHQLLAAIAEALEKTQFSRLARISSDHPKTSEFAHVVGQSPKLLEAIERAKLAANHDEPVLILGETGSGKDLFASEIHATSPRRKRPFLTTVVGARPEGTVLSELFGHVKSAFTGADKTSPGLLKTADGGTVFLDEIGDISFGTQVALLRAIETKKFQPVGSSIESSSDFRVIAATNRVLTREIDEGRFRSDLYYRLASFVIEIPALRERAEDIPLLAKKFIDDAVADGQSPPSLSASALKKLVGHSWPGNVRELHSVIRRAVYRTTESEVSAEAIELLQPTSSNLGLMEMPFEEAEANLREEYLQYWMNKTNGDIAKVADQFGKHAQTIRKWIREGRQSS